MHTENLGCVQWARQESRHTPPPASLLVVSWGTKLASEDTELLRVYFCHKIALLTLIKINYKKKNPPSRNSARTRHLSIFKFLSHFLLHKTAAKKGEATRVTHQKCLFSIVIYVTEKEFNEKKMSTYPSASINPNCLTLLL